MKFLIGVMLVIEKASLALCAVFLAAGMGITAWDEPMMIEPNFMMFAFIFLVLSVLANIPIFYMRLWNDGYTQCRK